MFKQCLGKGLVAGLLHGKVKGLDFFFNISACLVLSYLFSNSISHISVFTQQTERDPCPPKYQLNVYLCKRGRDPRDGCVLGNSVWTILAPVLNYRSVGSANL